MLTGGTSGALLWPRPAGVRSLAIPVSEAGKPGRTGLNGRAVGVARL